MLGIIGLLIVALIIKVRERWHIALYLVAFAYLLVEYLRNIAPFLNWEFNSYIAFANRLVIPALLIIVYLRTSNIQKSGGRK